MSYYNNSGDDDPVVLLIIFLALTAFISWILPGGL